MTPVKNNLVAIGSAAVLAVYSAGYIRTKEAADRFAVEDAELRQLRETRVATRVAAPAPEPTHAAVDSITQRTVAAPVQAAPHESATPKHTEVKKAENPHRAATTHADSTPAPVAAPVAKPAEPASSVVAAPPVAPPPSPVAPSPVAAPVPTPAQPAAADTSTADAPLKDGVYSGYGRSRHGDIEATVAIKNGKITEAFISQCLTQYSCSWIAALPPQVVARQSAEVDYVSGATQSTNAFYYAVIAALKKAK
jgi:uncharacterized protein with FMN-binding domain